MTTDDTMDGAAEDRRSLLKKAAVIGGAVWAAPVVLSLPAAAAVPSGACTGFSPTFGSPVTVGACGSVGLLATQNPGSWVIFGFPNAQPPATGPTITSLSITGATASNVNGLGTSSVTFTVTPPNANFTVCVGATC